MLVVGGCSGDDGGSGGDGGGDGGGGGGEGEGGVTVVRVIVQKRYKSLYDKNK